MQILFKNITPVNRVEFHRVQGIECILRVSARKFVNELSYSAVPHDRHFRCVEIDGKECMCGSTMTIRRVSRIDEIKTMI